MKQKSYYLSLLLIGFLSVGLLAYFGYHQLKIAVQEDRNALALSTVLIQADSGVASAVHIGNGYFLTANHVIPQRQREVVLATSLGQTFVANVLWISTDYDIALLHTTDINEVDIDSHILVCDALSIGDDLMFVGNPMIMRFVHTWGKVAAAPMSIDDRWKTFTPVNATIIPGMSGGPAIDSNGFLRGINVGTMLGETSMTMFGPALSFTGLSYIVEGKDLCTLMGINGS
jgi:serine protease Do